jgi:hypothetical protein
MSSELADEDLALQRAEGELEDKCARLKLLGEEEITHLGRDASLNCNDPLRLMIDEDELVVKVVPREGGSPRVTSPL